MLDLLPAAFDSILDVGSGSGHFLEMVKAARPDVETWAIDPSQDCSLRNGVDHFLLGSFPADVAPRTFDVIVFNDVLEHMEDPWMALRQTRRFLTSSGRVSASIPNVRHYSVVKPLLVSGRFTYQDAGILDRTHLRFFTLSGVKQLFVDTGFRVVECRYEHLTNNGTAASLLRLGGPLTKPFRARHVAVSARI